MSNQFEQWMNAAYIQKCGYGRHFSTYSQQGNQILFKKLDVAIRNLIK
jgi:hypothetical protein